LDGSLELLRQHPEFGPGSTPISVLPEVHTACHIRAVADRAGDCRRSRRKSYRDGEDEVAVVYRRQGHFAELLGKEDGALLLAGGAEIPDLTGERTVVLSAAFRTTDPGEAVLEQAAVREPVDTL